MGRVLFCAGVFYFIIAFIFLSSPSVWGWEWRWGAPPGRWIYSFNLAIYEASQSLAVKCGMTEQQSRSLFSIPRYFSLRSTVYPLPAIGPFLREYNKELYDCFYIDLYGLWAGNILGLFTYGWTTPYLLGFFMGNVYNNKQGSFSVGWAGRYGNKYIKYNEDIKAHEILNDDWFNIEWELKTEKKRQEGSLKRYIKLGPGFHRNEKIPDRFALSLGRDDRRANKLGFISLCNIGFKYELQIPLGEFSWDNPFIRHYLELSKKFPIKLTILHKFKRIDFLNLLGLLDKLGITKITVYPVLLLGVLYERYREFDPEMGRYRLEDKGNLNYFVFPNVIVTF